MANATLIVTTVMKTTNKEKAPDAAPGVNIVDFCEEYYEDILPIIMDKARRDKPSKTDSRNPSHSRGHHPKRERPRIEECSRSAEESYGDTYSQETKTKYRDRSRDGDRFRSVKRWRESETPSSRGSESSTSNRGHWKSRMKRYELVDEDDLAVLWTRKDVDPFTPRIRNFKSSRKTRMPNNVKTYDGTGDPKDHLKIFQAARDGETIEDFIERFKVETGRMKGAPKCMRISGFMHGVNNPELTKRLNEQVPKTMEEMMTVTTAFIRGEAAAASKKKGHLPWKLQDQPKQHASERKSDFRGQSRE
ncbi:hypothetical protein Tco_1448929 [Tanacetum coccineum]